MSRWQQAGLWRSSTACHTARPTLADAARIVEAATAEETAAVDGMEEEAAAEAGGINRSTYQVKPFYLSSETVLPIK